MEDTAAPPPPELDPLSHDRPTPVWMLAGAAVILGFALIVRDGNYHPFSIACVTAAIALAAWATLGPTGRPDRGAAAHVAVLLATAVLFQAALLVARSTLPRTPRLASPLALLPLVVAAIGAVALAKPRPWLWALLVAQLLAGVIVIRNNPQPVMDVFMFQSDAASVMLHGKNPYAIEFPDHSHGTSPFYGPGVQEGGRLKFGFPYLPLSLLLVTPSYGLSGDVRYTHLACVLGAAAFMGLSRPGPRATAGAALLLLAPAGLLVLSQSWTEPLVVVLLAATVWCACRRPDLLPLALGLFLAVKQYTFLSAPLALLLVPRPWTARKVWDLAWKAALVAVVVTLPLALWGPKAFWWSTVGVQMRQPFRTDALSYLAALANWKGVVLPAGVAFLAMVVVEVLALLRAPRTPAGFAASVGLAFLVFFAFNKQAFANYYYFVIGAFACAVAAADVPSDGASADSARVQSPPA